VQVYITTPVCKIGLNEISTDQPGNRAGVRLKGMLLDRYLKKDDVYVFSSASDICFMSSSFLILAL
jgi:hypothetical protein